MRVLAIDPGYGRCGLAVLEKQGPKDVLLHSECVETPPENDFHQRLGMVVSSVRGAIGAYSPQAVALEKLFLGKNKKTAMRVAEVRGAILATAAEANLPVFEYAPAEIKLAATGHGAADKTQVIKMVRVLIQITKPIALDDEYDAIAVGLAHFALYQGRAARALHSGAKQG